MGLKMVDFSENRGHILFFIYYVFSLRKSVQISPVNQSNSFEDVALNVDTCKSQNLELLVDAADFAKFFAMKKLMITVWHT